MSITHQTAARNAVCTAIAAQVNAGSTNPTPRIVIMAAADAVICTLNMSVTAFLTAASGEMDADTIADSDAATAGTAVAFKVTDRDNNEIYRGSAGDVGTEDLVLPDAAIGALKVVGIADGAFTYIAPV